MESVEPGRRAWTVSTSQLPATIQCRGLGGGLGERARSGSRKCAKAQAFPSAITSDPGERVRRGVWPGLRCRADHQTSCITLTNLPAKSCCARCTRRSKPGGPAVILEFVPNEDRVSPPIPASFSLTMLAGTPGGDAYTFSEHTTYAPELGLSPQRPFIPCRRRFSAW